MTICDTVETEMDLSPKQQFIDLVLIRKGPGPILLMLPDGFEDMGDHNLLTFKSHHQALDAWALWELIGHFVNYGKQHYRQRSEETSSLLYMLFNLYSQDTDMTDKMKEFVRETMEQIRNNIPVEERLKGIAAEERLKGLSAEERLTGLSAVEVVRALPPEILEVLTRKLKANGSSPKPQ